MQRMASLTVCDSCGGVIRESDDRACPSCEALPKLTRRAMVGAGVVLAVVSAGCDYGAPDWGDAGAPDDEDGGS